MRRYLDTYGGWSLENVEKVGKDLDIKIELLVTEPGVFNISRLAMGLKSGNELEIAYALNALAAITYDKDPEVAPVSLAQSKDLVDSLLEVFRDSMCILQRHQDDFIEKDKRKKKIKKENKGDTNEDELQETSHSRHCRKFYSYSDLFDLESEKLDYFIINAKGTRDIMKLAGEKALCAGRIIRNLSFGAENQVILANHPLIVDFILDTLFMDTEFVQDPQPDNLMDNTSFIKNEKHHEKSINDEHSIHGNNLQNSNIYSKKRKSSSLEWHTSSTPKWYIYALDHRKNALITLANVSAFITIPTYSLAKDVVQLLCDFIDPRIPLSESWYMFPSLEAISKLCLSLQNQEYFSQMSLEKQYRGGLGDLMSRIIRLLPMQGVSLTIGTDVLATIDTALLTLYHLVSIDEGICQLCLHHTSPSLDDFPAHSTDGDYDDNNNDHDYNRVNVNDSFIPCKIRNSSSSATSFSPILNPKKAVFSHDTDEFFNNGNLSNHDPDHGNGEKDEEEEEELRGSSIMIKEKSKSKLVIGGGPNWIIPILLHLSQPYQREMISSKLSGTFYPLFQRSLRILYEFSKCMECRCSLIRYEQEFIHLITHSRDEVVQKLAAECLYWMNEGR